MDDRHHKRQEEYHTDLAVDRLFDFPAAHADFLHNLVAFSVIITFGYLFVVDDECRCHQEYDSEEDTDEEKPTVKFIKTLSA